MNFSPDTALFCARLIQELYDGTTKPNVTHQGTDTQALVYPGAAFTYVIFPGTASCQDWITDVRIGKVPWIKGRVHAGFREATRSVLPAILKQLYVGKPLVIAGHSLGGALAMLCASAIREMGHNPIQSVYTFGQPRVGNWSFAAHYDANLHDETFRVVNAGDLVPKVPYVFRTYKHAGTEVYLKHGGGVTVAHPWWTSVVEAAGTVQQMAQANGTRPDPAQLSLNLPNHSIREYITKLEALA